MSEKALKTNIIYWLGVAVIALGVLVFLYTSALLYWSTLFADMFSFAGQKNPAISVFLPFYITSILAVYIGYRIARRGIRK